MTKVTNIYIDTNGLNDEQYAAADKALDELKSGDIVGHGSHEGPKSKHYLVMVLDHHGNRWYYNSAAQMLKSPNACKCQPVLLSDLVEMKLRANYEESLKLKKFRVIVDGKPSDNNSQPITTIDRMTPEKERAIVNGVVDALLSNRLISKMAHGVVTGAMQGYYSANDTQP